MNYIKLYKAANVSEAYFIKGLLEKASIDTQLLGEGLSVAIGELPLEVMQVDLLVHKDKFNKAKKIMSDYETQIKLNHSKKNWTCIPCGNSNPDTFELCWKCNKERN